MSDPTDRPIDRPDDAPELDAILDDELSEDLSGWMSTAGRLDPIEPVNLHTDRPQSARMYDYYLSGKTNFPVDRETAEHALKVNPQIRSFARANRAFMTRAVNHLTGLGIRQFLDIGTGIPTSPNVHETAQAAIPDARVVYVDNDPIVLAHARALLANSTPDGRIDYIQADAREPEAILNHPCLTGPDPALDLSRPVALQLIALMHFLPDDRDPHGVLKRLVDALPSGSYVVLTHATVEDIESAGAQHAMAAYRARGVEFQLRTGAEVAAFAAGLELVDPGVELLSRWRPDSGASGEVDRNGLGHGFVARKP
jgi:hypothetical protein